ncbi:MAG: MATE family efflux transporter [Bacillota bacterium]
MALTTKSERMGTEPVVSLLLRLSIPSIIGMSVQSLYNIIDSIYIGRLSTEALSALSLAFPIQMILIAVAVGTGVGTSSLISRLLGKGKEEKANIVAEHVVLVTLFFGLVLGSIGYFFSAEIFSFVTSDPKLIDLGEEYIRVILMGSFAMFFPVVASDILRGEGNTFVPMLTLVLGAVINIILDPFLIFGIGFFPRLEVAGAAYATIISRFIGGLFIAYLLFKGHNQVELNYDKFKFDFKIIKDVYRVGLPAMIMQLLASIMIFGANTIVGMYDTVAVAVLGIYFRLQSFVFMPVFGLAQGFMPIVGYNFGHKKPDRMMKTIKFGFLIAFSFTTAGLIIFQIFTTPLIQLFNDDPELLEIGVTALKRITLAFPIIGPAIIGSTTFQAIGKGLPSLIISFSRQIILLLPIMYFLGLIAGLDYLWLAFPISEGMVFIVMILWLRSTLKEAQDKMQ